MCCNKWQVLLFWDRIFVKKQPFVPQGSEEINAEADEASRDIWHVETFMFVWQTSGNLSLSLVKLNFSEIQIQRIFEFKKSEKSSRSIDVAPSKFCYNMFIFELTVY